MIKNGKDIPNGTVLSAQVCVIGTGPAGVTAAWELQKAGIKVILIEGSRPFPNYENSWPDKVLLYNGEAVGLFTTNEPQFLVLPDNPFPNFPRERERAYGGTSNHWGGQSRPEDPIDLEERPGFPGWHVTREELDPYYAQASVLCELYGDYGRNGENFTNEFWAKTLSATPPTVDGFDIEMYQFLGAKNLNFATRTFDGTTIGDSAAEVILNATLLDIDHQQGCVSGLRVASMSGGMHPKKLTEFTIKADAYVLACGAVANARQMLLANIGNEHDHVGRYFMAHALSSSSSIIQTLDSSYLTAEQAQFMGGQTPTGPFQDPNGVRANARFIPSAETVRREGIGRCWFWYNYGQYYFEQAPHRDSRVTLTDTVDSVFGQRQTKIDWQFNDLDEKTYNTATQLFANAVSALGGEISVASWETLESQLVVNGHHMGTTRMSKDPAKGVVDTNLKVHSMDNLYVAGSSIFPSGGISNPTFTIIMLSIRLAEHLRRVC